MDIHQVLRVDGFEVRFPELLWDALINACQSLAKDRTKKARDFLSKEEFRNIEPELTFEATMHGLVRTEGTSRGKTLLLSFFFSRSLQGEARDEREEYLDEVVVRCKEERVVGCTIEYGPGHRDY